MNEIPLSYLPPGCTDRDVDERMDPDHDPEEPIYDKNDDPAEPWMEEDDLVATP